MAKTRDIVIVRPLRRGQVTLPAEFRRRLGIGDDTLLQLSLHDDAIEVRPVVASPVGHRRWARDLYERFAPVRDAAADMSEAEIDSAIDAAVAEVRSRHGA